MTPAHFRIALLLSAVLVATSCGSDTPSEPEATTGSITVTVATSGVTLDSDGYVVRIGAAEQTIGVDGSVTFSGIATGSQSVTLEGIASNCTPTESNPQSVTVTTDQTVTVPFTVTCSRVLEDMTLLAVDAYGNVYRMNEDTGEATRLLTPVTDDEADAMVSIGLIGSMSWVWSADSWWLGPVLQSPCFGCLHVLDPSSGVSAFVAGTTVGEAVATGLAVHPTTGRVYAIITGGALYEIDPTTGLLTSVMSGIDPSDGTGTTFSNDGLLYVGGSGELGMIDIDAMTSSLIAATYTGFPSSAAGARIRSLATRETDGTVFGLIQDGDASYLFTLTLATAELWHVGGHDQRLEGLAYIPSRWVDEVAPSGPSRVVFVSDRNGNDDIFTTAPNGGDLVQVTDDPADDDDPSLSPDRTKVVFATERDGNWELYVTDADGTGTPMRLTDTPEGEWDATYSPDGSRILFLKTEIGTDNTDLYTMATDGTDIVQVTTDSDQDVNPAWSPDGSQIVFQTNRDGDWEVYVANADGSGTPMRLTEGQDVNGDPDWSPDGSRIAFDSKRSGEWEVWLMDPDGSNPVRLTTNGGQEPVWSPDGAQIVFSRRRDGCCGGDWELLLMNADGSGQRPITNNPADDEEPEWR